jgi:hypothetical protein
MRSAHLGQSHRRSERSYKGHNARPRCRRWNTIYYSELGSATAILRAGYNIDCLMAKYQGVDWRDRSNWECNLRCDESRQPPRSARRGDPASRLRPCVLQPSVVTLECAAVAAAAAARAPP